MPPSPDPSLAIAAHPLLAAGAWGAVGLLLLSALGAASGLFAPARRLLGTALVLHLATLAGRGIAIGSFPLTSKAESFSGGAFALALVTFLAWRPSRSFLLPMQGLALAAFAASLRFPQDLRYPVLPLRTIWYPLHVPLSFVSYALWAAAAAAAIALLVERDEEWRERAQRLALQGFGLWTVSMVFGGIWGVVAWGAWFLWDPKIVWSVILWFHYAAFVHLRYAPSLARRPWPVPLLALAGLLWVFVAWVGTSFLFGRSSHAF